MNFEKIKTIDQLRLRKALLKKKFKMVLHKTQENASHLVGSIRLQKNSFWFSKNSIFKGIGYTIVLFRSYDLFRKIIFALKR